VPIADATPAPLAKPPIRTARRTIAEQRANPQQRSGPQHRGILPPTPRPGWSFHAPETAQYVVPRTFGMSAILGIITALAILFGAFHFYDAHPLLYLFFGVQAIVICVAQMLYGKTPRAASAISGGLLLPAFVLVSIGLFSRWRVEGALCLMVVSVPTGAFFGYITGTMAAGVFLVMDSAERLLTAWRGGLER
jgi:hypothetical protein